MRRVRIKKYPAVKRKVRIKKMPGLPESPGYANGTQYVFQRGGLNKFIPAYSKAGATGGLNSPLDKSPITFGLQNTNAFDNPFTRNTVEEFGSGIGMGTDGNFFSEPLVKTGEPAEEKTDEGTDGNYEVTYKEKKYIEDGKAAATGLIGGVDAITGVLQNLNPDEQELRFGDTTKGNTEIAFTGDHNKLSGLKNEDRMGAKVLNVTNAQRGGAIPKFSKAGAVAMVNGVPMTQAEVNAWLDANPGKRSAVKWIKSRDAAYDEGYYDTKDRNILARGVTQKGKDRSGDFTVPTNITSFSSDVCATIKKGRDGKAFTKEEALAVQLVTPERADEFEACYRKVKDEVVDVELIELDEEQPNPGPDPCPECEEGFEKGTPTEEEPCPCVKKPEDSSTGNCKCPGDPEEGPFTGTIVTNADGSQECECSGQQTTPNYESAPEFWLQDTLKTTGLAGDLATLKKYMPQKQSVDLEEQDVSFVDPTRELAANAEQANIASQAASSFAGPQSSGRLSAIQGKAAAGNADIMNRYNQQNLGIANQALAANAGIRNQEALQNAKFDQQYYDQTTVANQQFDNSKRAMSTALRDQYANAITNAMQTDAMNQQYPNYAVDPARGGKMNFTGNDGRQLNPTYQKDIDAYEKDYLGKGIDAETAAKLALKRVQGEGVFTGQGQPQGGAYYGYPGGRTSQLGGATYEHGGEHSPTFGTTNMNQLTPSTYTNGVNESNIPFASRTTSTISSIPRDQANLEAEGGETVFGDINGDGFPETNRIEGPRHSDGGVPLNLPDDSFIYSDYKRGSMKISDPDVLKMFGKSGSKKGRKKPSYTPAQLAKQYDINKYRALLQDPNADKISKRTAELMIENYNMKLGALALVQESSKGFPQGIPKVARPYMEDAGISEEQLMPEQQETVSRPQQPMSFTDAEVIEEQT